MERLIVISQLLLPVLAQLSIGNILTLVFGLGFFACVIVGIASQHRTLNDMGGIWYCRELKMQISLTDPLNAFLMQNGEKIQCRCEKGLAKYCLGFLEVWCCELEHPRYKHGKTLLAARILEYTEMSMVVYDQKTHQKYTFMRTDKIG